MRLPLLLLLLALGASPVGSATALRGDTTAAPGDTACTACVPDPVAQVRALSEFGTALGFHWGAEHPPVDGFVDHWQGLVRIFAPAAGFDGRDLILVSNAPEGGAMARVRMASRRNGGGRFGSNRLRRGVPPSGVEPAAEDRIVASLRLSPAYRHPGGMQAAGRYLAVPFEEAQGPELHDDAGGTERHGLVVGLRLRARRSEVVWELPTPDPGVPCVALGRLADGRFLLVVAGQGTQTLHFHVSTTRDPANPGWRPLADWSAGDVRTEILVQPTERTVWRRYQTIQLLTDCRDGQLYLAGLGGPRLPGLGERDWVDLYRLDLDEAGSAALTRVARRLVYCNAGEGRICHLQAAATLHVTPDRTLTVLSGEHDNDGPGGTVSLAEFARVPFASRCEDPSGAWVVLFEEPGFRGRTWVLDWVDRGSGVGEDVRATGFPAAPGSLMLLAPEGLGVTLAAEAAGEGARAHLAGTGEPVRVVDLPAWLAERGFPRSGVRSVRFDPVPAVQGDER